MFALLLLPLLLRANPFPVVHGVDRGGMGRCYAQLQQRVLSQLALGE